MSAGFPVRGEGGGMADARAAHDATLDVAEIEVVAPNLKRRLSGVTSTIVQLVPVQARSLRIATIGPGLPGSLPHLKWWQVPGLLRPMVYEGKDSPVVNALVDEIVSHPVLAAVKALTGHIHGDDGYGAMRPPLEALDAATRKRLFAAFDSITQAKAA